MKDMTIPGILLAGLLDGINPCAISMLMVFYSFLLMTENKKKIILMSSMFIFGIFMANLSFGLGIKTFYNYFAGNAIIMYVLYLTSFLIVLSLVLDMIINQTNLFLMFDNLKEKFSNLLFMTTSWLILFYSFTGFEEKESKTNFVLNIIVMVVIILVHLNYFINPNLQTIISETTIGEKALYITQNYIYFGIMYVLLIANKFIKVI